MAQQETLHKPKKKIKNTKNLPDQDIVFKLIAFLSLMAAKDTE